MAFSVGDIIKDVYAHWNRPSEQDLPQGDLITIINRKINRLLLLLQLSDRNYLAKLSPSITFGTNRAISLASYDDLSSIVRVESRSMGDTNEENWTEEVITDYGSWNDSLNSRVDSVAFYGLGESLMMAVNRDANNLEFRILYETGGVSLSNFADSVPTLQDFFRSTVFYGAAAEAGMQIDNLNAEAEKSRDKKVMYLANQEAQSIAEFKKWLLNEPGQAVSYREAFNSTRTNSGQPRMFAQDGLGGYYSRF